MTTTAAKKDFPDMTMLALCSTDPGAESAEWALVTRDDTRAGAAMSASGRCWFFDDVPDQEPAALAAMNASYSPHAVTETRWGDLFYSTYTDAQIERVFAVMAATPPTAPTTWWLKTQSKVS